MSDLYSVRNGRQRPFDSFDFAKLIWHTVKDLAEKGLWVEALVEHPDDVGMNTPALIVDPTAFFLRRLREDNVADSVVNATKRRLSFAPSCWATRPDSLWDSLELLHELASAPVAEIIVDPDGQKYDPGFFTYDKGAGGCVLVDALNPDLALNEPPMMMLKSGEIIEQLPSDLEPVLTDPLPDDLPAPIREPLAHAIELYRKRGNSLAEKKAAVKLLADALEPLRNDIDTSVLAKDERALFDIANGFAIRHNNRTQARQYDQDIWIDWMFYVYAATARALVKILDRETVLSRVVDQDAENDGHLPI